MGDNPSQKWVNGPHGDVASPNDFHTSPISEYASLMSYHPSLNKNGNLNVK